MSGPDFDWAAADLAVGAAFKTRDIPRLVEARVGAVVDLRGEGCDDAAALARAGVAFLHLPTRDHCALAPADMDAGAAFAREQAKAGRGLLVHCREGIGRSVTLALCILADRGVEPLAAMAQIKDARYWASPSPAQFDAFAAWLERRGIAPPAFDALAAIAYRHLA